MAANTQSLLNKKLRVVDTRTVKTKPKSKVHSAASGSGQVIKKVKRKVISPSNSKQELTKPTIDYQTMHQPFNSEPMSLLITPHESPNKDLDNYLGHGVI